MDYYEHLRYEQDGPVTVVMIDRPERMNAVGPATARELVDAWTRFRDDDDALVGILTGAGEDAFCAGGDLKAAFAGDAGTEPPARRRLTRPLGGGETARMLRIACLVALTASLAAAAPAAAAPRISVSPRAIDPDETQIVRGRDWPVIEFCERRVVVKVKSDQNSARLGSARVRRSGRFRFEWTADGANVGSGPWRLVVRMRCEIGDDGSAVFVRRSRAIRVR
jgi:hypothetical protein